MKENKTQKERVIKKGKKMIRKQKESQGDGDGHRAWIYLGFSERHILEKSQQSGKVRGFCIKGGTKKKQEVKEKTT